MIQHTSPISGIAASDQFVATAGYDNQVILWDKNNRSLARATHDHLANSCSFSADGRFLLTASSDYTARLFTVPDLKLIAVFSDQTDDVEMAAICPHQKYVATASRDHQVRLYTINGTLLKTFSGHGADVISANWDETGENIITTSDDGTIRLWNLADREKHRILSQGNNETDTLIVVDSETFVAGNDNGQIMLIKNGQTTLISAHASGIKKIVFDPKNRRFISMSYDRSCIVWQLSESNEVKKLHVITLPSLIWPRSAAFVDENTIAFATFGSTFATYYIKEGVWNLDPIKETHGLNAVVLFNDDIYGIGDSGTLSKNRRVIGKTGSLCNFIGVGENVLISGGQEGIVYHLQKDFVAVYRHHSPLNCSAWFSFKGANYFVVGSYTGEAIILKETSNTSIHFVKAVKLFENAIKAITSDNETVFAVCATGEVNFVSLDEIESDFSDFAGRRFLGHDKIANSCCTLSQGLFASTGRDLKLRLWSCKDGAVALEKIVATPHDHSIKSMTALGQRYLYLGSYDGQVARYDTVTGTWSQKTRISHAGVSCLFGASESVLAATYDGVIHSLSEMEFLNVESN